MIETINTTEITATELKLVKADLTRLVNLLGARYFTAELAHQRDIAVVIQALQERIDYSQSIKYCVAQAKKVLEIYPSLREHFVAAY